MKRISGLKHFAIYLIAVAIAGTGIWFAYRMQHSDKIANQDVPTSHIVYGQVASASTSEVVVSGIHVIDGNGSSTDFNNRLPISAKINLRTKFVRMIWYMPSSGELAKVAGKFDSSTVKKEQQKGNVFDLRKGLNITITTDEDTISKQTVTAASISYVVPVYPKK